MERYAFIDASNTASTTRSVLGFKIDWNKVFGYLRSEKWHCKEILFYEGRRDELLHEKRHQVLEEIGYIVRSKPTFVHKTPDRKFAITCTSCGVDQTASVNLGPHPKSNCDVELTVDALERAQSGSDFLIFTGDGDFRYLIEKLIEKGVTVRIISSTAQTKGSSCRFSTRLKELLRIEENNAASQDAKPRVQFIDINSWRIRVEDGSWPENKRKRHESVTFPNAISNIAGIDEKSIEV